MPLRRHHPRLRHHALGTRHREAILQAVPDAVFADWARFLAPPLAAVALRRAAAGATVSPSDLRPLYLRAADIRPPRA